MSVTLDTDVCDRCGIDVWHRCLASEGQMVTPASLLRDAGSSIVGDCQMLLTSVYLIHTYIYI